MTLRETYGVVSAEEYDALAERLAEAEAARDQWHADYSRVVAASEERMRRLAEAERLLAVERGAAGAAAGGAY
jgi:hypothetical protein